MPTFNNVTNNHFKQQASEFFQMTQDRSAVTFDQAVNGNRALALLWLGRTDDWTEQQIQESMIILDLASKREMEIAFN